MNPHALLAVLFGLGLGALAIYAVAPFFEKILLSKTLARYQFVRIFGTADWTSPVVTEMLQRLRDKVTSLAKELTGECQLRQRTMNAKGLTWAQDEGSLAIISQLRSLLVENERRLVRAESAFAMYCYDRPLAWCESATSQP